MIIYFINKSSKLKGPFDITNACRKKIMNIGDVCIRDTHDGLSFLLICSEENKWSACKCVEKTQGDIGLEGNSLLFSFDGITKRFGRENALNKLYKCFSGKTTHDFFRNALDIITYQCDYWEVSLFLEIHQVSTIKNESQVCIHTPTLNNYNTRFEMYLPPESAQLLSEMMTKGFSLREAYNKVREVFPKEFRQSLKSFLKDNPSLTIYDK